MKTRLTIRIATFSFLATFATLLAGCGSGGNSSKGEVKGKVLLGDKPVAGAVVFSYADGKEATAPIQPDGSYTMLNPEAGSVKVYIKSQPGVGGTVAAPKTGSGPEMPKDMGGAGSQGVAPPAKFTSATTSGLTFEVKGGKQDYSPELK